MHRSSALNYRHTIDAFCRTTSHRCEKDIIKRRRLQPAMPRMQHLLWQPSVTIKKRRTEILFGKNVVETQDSMKEPADEVSFCLP
jgi:hypothetical protein